MKQDDVVLHLWEYWEKLRAGRSVPLRAEIDPRQIKAALDSTFILEQTKSGGLRFRLVGSQLCDSMGIDLRGIPAFAIIAPSAREIFETALQATLTPPGVTEISLLSTSVSGVSTPSRMILLPLASDDGAINRILGCVSRSTQAPVPPARYDVVDVRTKRIITGLDSTVNTSWQGFGEAKKPYIPNLAGPLGQLTPIAGNPNVLGSPDSRERPVFTVIEGGLSTKKAP